MSMPPDMPRPRDPNLQETASKSKGILQVDRAGKVSIEDPSKPGIDRPTQQFATKSPTVPFLVLPSLVLRGSRSPVLPTDGRFLDESARRSSSMVLGSIDRAVNTWIATATDMDHEAFSNSIMSTFYQEVAPDESLTSIFVTQNLPGENIQNPLSVITDKALQMQPGTINLPEGWNARTLEEVSGHLRAPTQRVSFDVARAFCDMGAQVLVHNDQFIDGEQSERLITQTEQASIGFFLHTMANAEFLESLSQQSGPIASA